MKYKVAVFASGYGSNFEALISESKNIKNTRIVLLVADRDCRAVQIAIQNDIDVHISNDADSILSILLNKDINLILLAGYLKLIPSIIIDRFPLRILNIHPSLLPKYKGLKAISRAFNSEDTYSGVSIHYVNDKLDEGVIITQEKILISDKFEAFERNIHSLEHKLYKNVLRLFTETKKAVVVSKCLLGVNSRYDGTNKLSRRVLTFIEKTNSDVFFICPEADGGMPTPREPIDKLNDLPKTVHSYVDNLMRKLAKYEFVEFILKDKSPSCGTKLKRGLVVELASRVLKDKKKIFITENDL